MLSQSTLEYQSFNVNSVNNVYTYVLMLSQLQTTLALISLKESSHTVPQVLLLKTSTRPSLGFEPPTRRTLEVLICGPRAIMRLKTVISIDFHLWFYITISSRFIFISA